MILGGRQDEIAADSASPSDLASRHRPLQEPPGQGDAGETGHVDIVIL